MSRIAALSSSNSALWTGRRQLRLDDPGQLLGSVEGVAHHELQGNYEEMAQKLTADLSAGPTPDVSLLSDVWWFNFHLNGALAPLDDFIAAEGVDPANHVDSLYGEQPSETPPGVRP